MRKATKKEIENEPGYFRKVFYSAEDKCWVAVAPEIPGCSALGDTDSEALRELDNAIKLHLRIRKENKLPIPTALAGQKLGGRFLLRIPKALQHDLKEEAMEEGVSVNQYALYLISTARAQLHPFGKGL
ncbi:MAG: type II toxin-antitoxin system HicB family antitoxin [Elusimicrobiales bacterium]|jgi:predicted RNase H-like HicB family nuclease